jgi:hypothetical protein
MPRIIARAKESSHAQTSTSASSAPPPAIRSLPLALTQIWVSRIIEKGFFCPFDERAGERTLYDHQHGGGIVIHTKQLTALCPESRQGGVRECAARPSRSCARPARRVASPSKVAGVRDRPAFAEGALLVLPKQNAGEVGSPHRPRAGYHASSVTPPPPLQPMPPPHAGRLTSDAIWSNDISSTSNLPMAVACGEGRTRA